MIQENLNKLYLELYDKSKDKPLYSKDVVEISQKIDLQIIKIMKHKNK
ncbi:hypothetical protein [Natronospora cellulosivora (SeqCode)]